MTSQSQEQICAPCPYERRFSALERAVLDHGAQISEQAEEFRAIREEFRALRATIADIRRELAADCAERASDRAERSKQLKSNLRIEQLLEDVLVAVTPSAKATS